MSGIAEPAWRITPFLRCLYLVGNAANGGKSPTSSASRDSGSGIQDAGTRRPAESREGRGRDGRPVQTATGSATAPATTSFFTERSAKKAPVGSTDITRIQASRLPVHLR